MKINKGKHRSGRPAASNSERKNGMRNSSSTNKSKFDSSEIENTKEDGDNTPRQVSSSNSAIQLGHDSAGIADAEKSNSSTPRRKKNPLSNLYSTLSPKYIGFSTPKSAKFSEYQTSSEGRCRTTRRRKFNNSIGSFSQYESTSDILASSADVNGYVRRTNSAVNITSSRKLSNDIVELNTHRKIFESPIEKLLRKNRSNDSNSEASSPAAAFESNIMPMPRKTIERKELMDIKVNVERVQSLERLHKNGINTFQLDEHGNVINIASKSINEEIVKTKDKSRKINSNTSSRDLQQSSIDKLSDLPSSLDHTSELTQDIATEDNIIESKDTEINSTNLQQITNDKELSSDDCSVKSFNDNSPVGSNETKSDDVLTNDDMNNDHLIETNSTNNKEDCKIDQCLDPSDNSGNTIENVESTPDTVETTECMEVEDIKSKENESEDDKNNVADNNNEIENVESNSNDCPTEESPNENPVDTLDDKSEQSYDVDKDGYEDLGTGTLDVESINNEPPDGESIDNEHPDGESIDKEQISKGQKLTHDNNMEIIESMHAAEDVDLENSLLDENTMSLKSPSSISMDSAKGSSVNNDISWVSFSSGDIFWGQIYSYCYWPCMVCPDPEGKTITTVAGIGRSSVSHVMVHVRFFADNARRNWVKRDNLLTYNGLADYTQKMLEVSKKYGKKSTKYKAFIVSKAKQRLWYQAIEEANILNSTEHKDRMEKFFEIYENSKTLNKLDRKRRQSLYITLGSTSDIGSLYDSSDNLSAKQLSVGIKRERSISPFSPAYSPVGPKTSKRRKLSENDHHRLSSNTLTNDQDDETRTMESSLSQSSSMSTQSSQDAEIFNGNEFKRFYNMMKDFVMEENRDDKLERSLIVAVRNIWALRHINERQMQARLMETYDENALGLTESNGSGNYGSLKRLSTRLRNLSIKKNVTKLSNPQVTITDPKAIVSLTHDDLHEEKMRKPLNRPIEEVIDDIFNLDSKYLFKGLGRDHVCKYCLKPGGVLEKCSKNCQSWFHVDCIGKSTKQLGRKYGRKKANMSAINLEDSTVDRNLTLHITSESTQHDTLEEQKTATKEDSMTSSISNLEIVPTTTNTNPQTYVCHECSVGEEPKCAVCNRCSSDLETLVFCNIPHCTNAFHPSCCRYWPQAKITKSKNKIESFRCPSHVCHTCVSDDPKGKFQNISSTKLTKCVKCPATFHTDSTCVPAGSQILTAAYIICPRHSISKSDQKVNVNWCFICVGGGQVVCCETCPTAVHAPCLNIAINSDEGYICEECETGRMPLYGEMVWAKFNTFRWWPALILPPTEVPHNIMRMSHSPSDFVVRFFGTHDHGWISRRRVYLYLEGDSTEPPRSKTSLDNNYTRGVEEAKKIWEIIKSKKHMQRLTYENKQKVHPQPYVKIKSNRAVPPLKLHIDLEKVSKCECKKDSENPCGPDSNCLNRVLYHECNPKLCPAGERCQNQMFESRISPKLEVLYMKERGFGLVCKEPISAGTFVIEYVGEVINDDEFKQRMTQKAIDRDENFYFLSLEKDYIIDAGPKGNLARFMNHSCDPNCETQKWCVNGLNRVGLFAIRDIPGNTELTFNYHWDELLGSEKKTCYCGAAKCAGQIGGKFKDTKIKDDVKVFKNKNAKTSKTKGKALKRLQSKKSTATSSGVKQFIKITPKSNLKKITKPKDSISSPMTSTVVNSENEMNAMSLNL